MTNKPKKKKSRDVGRKIGNRRYFPLPGFSFRSKKVAQNKAKKLRKAGKGKTPIRVIKGQKNKQPIYRVYGSPSGK